MDFAYKSKMRFLGICTTKNLKWDIQVQSLNSKLNEMSYIRKSMKELTSPYMTKSIYDTNCQ